MFANLSASVIFKLINMAISFMMVPITLDYLDKSRYGLWAAISSLLAWFFIFDIGIGNGLRNKYTELKAKGRITETRSYISTAYCIFGFLALLFFIVFLFLNGWVDWADLLNAPRQYKDELNETIIVTMMLLCILFVSRLINTILSADLKNSLSDALSVVSHVISFIGIIILSRFTTPSILKYAALYTGVNLLVSLLASFILYNTIYRDISPRIRSINLKLSRELVSVGVKFFFIQIAAMALFHSTSLVISSLVNPDSVVAYNITQKYFSIVALVFTMMVQPLWTGYGEAYHKGEYQWIRKTFKRLMILWAVIMCALIIMLLLQKPIFSIWLKHRIQVDTSLSILFIVYFALQMVNSIFNPLINASSKLKLTLYIIPLNVTSFLGLSYLFTQSFGLGARGVLISLIVSQGIPAAVLGPLQCSKILKDADGIWNE